MRLFHCPFHICFSRKDCLGQHPCRQNTLTRREDRPGHAAPMPSESYKRVGGPSMSATMPSEYYWRAGGCLQNGIGRETVQVSTQAIRILQGRPQLRLQKNISFRCKKTNPKTSLLYLLVLIMTTFPFLLC